MQFIIILLLPYLVDSVDKISGCNKPSNMAQKYVLDFHSDFKTVILEGKKKATTRILDGSIEGSEPILNQLVDAFNVNVDSKESPFIVAASCTNDEEGFHIFGELVITRIEVCTVNDITVEIACSEDFINVFDFVECLRRFYPTLSDDNVVHVFQFDCV